MHGPLWNQIAMAAGFTLLLVFGLNEAASTLYYAPAPKQKAYVVEGVVEETAGESGETGEEPADALPDFGTVLAAADVAAGEKVAQRCVQCHTWDNGGPNKIGPNLWSIVGAPHAKRPDFNYSAANRAMADKPWDYAELYKFLKKPAAYMPGTKMAFAGLPRAQDRINLLAYMRTWADTPAPLPAPAPAAATEAAPADAANPVDAPAPEPATDVNPAPATPEQPAQGAAPAAGG